LSSTIELIRDWAAGITYWEQAVLEKLAAGVTLTEKDHHRFLNLMIEDTGLAAKPHATRPTFVFPAKGPDVSPDTAFTMERLSNLRNVNALPPAQQLTFGPQLTIIYGPNGSGKTGYTRPLGCAAFARGEREVLTDARKASIKQAPAADIEILKDGKKTTVSWTYGTDSRDLSGVYVFDGTSAAVHLTRPNALSFSPAGLALLTDLATVTDQTRERLRKLIEGKSAPHNFGGFFSGDSIVSREMGTLGPKTDIAKLRQLATVAGAEAGSMPDLEQQIAVLKTQNIPLRLATLRQQVRDLQRLVEFVRNVNGALDVAVERQVTDLITEMEALRHDAERVGADQFQFAQFTQVGTQVWREFIGVAKRLAGAESQPGVSYPNAGDHCLLCRQTLSPQAIDLMNRLWDFLESDAPARYKAAQARTASRANQFRSLDLSFFGADASSRRILENEIPAQVAALDAFLNACTARSLQFQTALNTGALGEIPKLELPSLEPILATIAHREQELSQLQSNDPSTVLQQLGAKLRELQHRQTLAEHLVEIVRWIDDQKWCARAQKAIGSTRHITAKYNELFKTLVTDRYQTLFEDILRKLKRNLKLTIETRGHKGETVRQIVLSPESFAQKAAIDKVLSDGEKRAVALADFLTEVTLDTSSKAIILDDPVSSLDGDSKTSIANILAEQAASRQVIIFTHDLMFLHALKVTAKKINIDIVSHWMRIEDDQPGYVYFDNSPLCEGDYKSANVARECYAVAKNAPPAEQERALQQGFGALRTSYEAFIIYDLFNEVVKRFEERVSFERLRDVSIDKATIDQVVEKLSILSRYIDAHLHSDTFLPEKPTPEHLLQEIHAFEELRRDTRERKKSGAASSSGPTRKTQSAATEAPSRAGDKPRPRPITRLVQ